MKLTINSVTEEFTGTYKVVVSNEMGKDESSAECTVKVSSITNLYNRISFNINIRLYSC